MTEASPLREAFLFATVAQNPQPSRGSRVDFKLAVKPAPFRLALEETDEVCRRHKQHGLFDIRTIKAGRGLTPAAYIYRVCNYL